MEARYNIGDIVNLGIHYSFQQSRVFGIVGQCVLVDFFDSFHAIHRREEPVPMELVKLISGAKEQEFKLDQIKKGLPSF